MSAAAADTKAPAVTAVAAAVEGGRGGGAIGVGEDAALGKGGVVPSAGGCPTEGTVTLCMALVIPAIVESASDAGFSAAAILVSLVANKPMRVSTVANLDSTVTVSGWASAAAIAVNWTPLSSSLKAVSPAKCSLASSKVNSGSAAAPSAALAAASTLLVRSNMICNCCCAASLVAPSLPLSLTVCLPFLEVEVLGTAANNGARAVPCQKEVGPAAFPGDERCAASTAAAAAAKASSSLVLSMTLTLAKLTRLLGANCISTTLYPRFQLKTKIIRSTSEHY